MSSPSGPRAARPGPEPDDTPTGQFSTAPPTRAGFSPVTEKVTSTANTPTPGTGRHAADAPEAAERGSLSIEDVVVEKVAVAAAAEIDGVGGAARRVLGVPTGRDDGDGRPRASARVSGQTAAVEVRLTVAYPASVRETTEAVRAHVRDRVEALTELSVARVDISVAALTRGTSVTRRVIA
ncbi:Asp23/Gls24 family envelope stress response protein [Actinomycetospora sp. NBRC 106378]|uniref:Asp23/Gls24 family envelope stress response protein n=1 Tax=Actinomycetospora sp. NBRC 106378 TaxID=3032208 RepID=UPI0024A4DF30|nr:Asp23/Gls24 family envelope stress response protein [Actinomycetospora sp. NBRC 106378]GLZ53489.1 hypothetical protein Acsp07_31060 [Actinomycetospora sp. NBRC 106378]